MVYAALGPTTFLLIVQLQSGLGYTALAAGAALLPMTVLVLALLVALGRPGPADRGRRPHDGRPVGDRDGRLVLISDRAGELPRPRSSRPSS